MITLRQRIFILSGVIVGLVIVLILVVSLDNDPEVGSEGETTVDDQTDVVSDIDRSVSVPAERETDQGSFPEYGPDEQAARQTARVFVERFASFSNQNQNMHIEDALALSTSNMTKWLETQRQQMSNEYTGVTTRVQAIKVRNLAANRATVGVSVQRSFGEKNGETRMEQNEGRVELLKQQNQWKVNGFYWE